MDASITRETFEETQDIRILLKSQSTPTPPWVLISYKEEECYGGESYQTVGQD